MSTRTAPSIVRTVRSFVAYPTDLDTGSTALAAVLSAAAFVSVASRDLYNGYLADMVPVAAAIVTAIDMAAQITPAGDTTMSVTSARTAALAALLSAAASYSGRMVLGEPPFAAAASSGGDGSVFALAVGLINPAGGASFVTSFANLTLPNPVDGTVGGITRVQPEYDGTKPLLGMSVLVQPARTAAYKLGDEILLYKRSAVTVRVSGDAGSVGSGWGCPTGSRCLILRIPVVLPPALLAEALTAVTAGEGSKLVPVCLRHSGTEETEGKTAEAYAILAIELDKSRPGAAFAICDSDRDGVFEILLAPPPQPTQPLQVSLPVMGLTTDRHSMGTAAAVSVCGLAAALAAMAFGLLLPAAVSLVAREESTDQRLGMKWLAAAFDFEDGVDGVSTWTATGKE